MSAIVSILCSIYVFTLVKLANSQNPCDINPCQNNGACIIITDKITSCQCLPGYTGTFCETPIDCRCQNGGTCLYSYLTFSYSCRCPPDRSGPNCELINPCYFSPCKNGATCSLSSNNDPVCTCLPGFTGQYCNIKIGPNGCQNNNVCQNGGTCFSELSYFGQVTEFCKCPANILGQYCEIKITNELCSSVDTNYLLCPIWLMLGFCDYQYKYGYVPVPIACPNSCSLCKRFPSCQDSQSNCILWKSFGLCYKVNEIDPNLCRKSCDLCPLNIV